MRIPFFVYSLTFAHLVCVYDVTIEHAHCAILFYWQTLSHLNSVRDVTIQHAHSANF
jgi:hypothetical protein